MGWLRRCRSMVLAVFALVLSAGSVFAQEEGSSSMGPACTAMYGGTSVPGQELGDCVGCMIETFKPTSQIARILYFVVPVLMIGWGLRSGTGLVKSVFRFFGRLLGRSV